MPTRSARRGADREGSRVEKEAGSTPQSALKYAAVPTLTAAHLAAIIESSDDAIVSKGLDGRVQSWNASAERIFGYTAQEMIGQPITRIIPPELQDQEDMILRALGKGERIEHYETVRIAKDGRRLEVSLTVSPVRDTSGEIVGAAKIARDITERKRAELRLHEEARALDTLHRVYRAIGDSIDFGIWVCDAEGRNTYVSDSFLKLTGLTQAQCAEFGWKSVLHPQDVDRTLVAWQECVRRGGTWDFEHRFLGTDGKYHPVLARGVPVRDDAGNILCWAGINLDIGEIKNAEEELLEADRRKDEFLAILAHELRNPLAPMRYALAVARQRGRTAEHQRQAEDVIDRQLKHMSRLLDDLLDVSRITHGTLEIRKAHIELTSIVATAIEAARPLIDAKGHDLTLELPLHTVRLEADLVRLSQVFANLLINAAKYTDPGGRISLRAWQEEGKVVVSVRDNGIGIAPEMMPRMFTLFSQARSALDRSEGGLGIGLALVKGVVGLHGGSIEARSAGIRMGSEFIVRLPMSTPHAVEVTDPSNDVTPPQGAQLRMLVADDNRDNAETCAVLLRLRGHEVHTAHSGKAAFELAQQLRPQVLLLDIGMPELNGYELARKIRAVPWGNPMVLIAITGWGQQEDKERAIAAGFNHHLTKPIDPAQLDTLLRESAELLGLEPVRTA